MSAAMERRVNMEAGPSRITDGQAPRKKKHPKVQPASLVRKATIPRPYLATAPKPISALSQSTIDHLAQPASARLLLPSTYVRSRTAPSAVPTTSTLPAASGSRPGSRATVNTGGRRDETGQRRKYAAGLAAPPTIIPGGKPNAPLAFQSGEGTGQPRRRSAPRVGIGTAEATSSAEGVGSGAPRRRSESALRSGVAAGQPTNSARPIQALEVIDESTLPAHGAGGVVGAGRVRRRRTALLTAEETRALGLARTASMRRTNVWDNLPETDDPPPAFPFPSATGARLPPTIEAVEAEDGERRSTAGPTVLSARVGGEEGGVGGRPRSPPPGYDVATTTPFAMPQRSDQAEEELGTTSSIPGLAVQPTSRSPSPASTAFVSAPSSPVLSAVSHATSISAVGPLMREDRQAWLEDLEAGYTLDERVQREVQRRQIRETASGRVKVEKGAQDNVAEDEWSTEAPILISREQASSELPPTVETGPEEPQPSAEPSISTTGATTIPSAATDSPSPSPLAPNAPPEPAPPTAQSLPPAAELTHPDTVLSTPTPQRKLTRGKAIRRSSSDSISPTLQRRRSSQISLTQVTQAAQVEPESPKIVEEPDAGLEEGMRQTPLFATKAFDPTPNAAVAAVQGGEASAIPTETVKLASPPMTPETLTQETVDQTSVLEGLPQQVRLAPVGVDKTVLLPHREAAMRRRHLTLRRRADPAAPPASRRHFDPNALINLYDEDEPAELPTTAVRGLPTLPEDLMELVENRPETVSQLQPEHEPAPRATTTAPLPNELEKENAGSIATANPMSAAGSVEGSIADSQASRRSRVPPPAPTRAPSIALRNAAIGAGVKRRMSILSTADRDILPNYRPSIRRARPPPPPLPTAASVTSPLASATSTAPLMGFGSPDIVLPSSENGGFTDEGPPPPLPHTADGVTRYALIDKPLPARIPPPLPSRPAPVAYRPSLTVRPKGPRPPPPPPRPRTWAKVVSLAPQLSPSSEISEPLPALTERSRSDTNVRDQTSSAETPLSPIRSHSAVEVRSPIASASDHSGAAPSLPLAPARQPSMEYTDLDVLLSRMEGSGRTFEGYSQLTAFLGPAKPTAASAADLALLLPGPVEVDSRRVTAQGKTKLKLSLLGVRVAKCPICLAQFKEGERGVLMPHCGHAGHERCARRWLRENGECWVCRARLGHGEEPPSEEAMEERLDG